MTIVESGMTFGPFGEGECFEIEASSTYAEIKDDGVKMAEFLLLRHVAQTQHVWIIEAKSSSPRPGNHLDFPKFIGELRDKLANGLQLGLASCLGRHPATEHELPQSFRDLDLKQTKFLLIVVINGHQDDWLADIDDALNLALRATVKTWALGANSVKVLNDRLARKHGLISDA